MAKIERMHEHVSGAPAPELLERRTGEGWRLVGLEWEREIPGEAAELHETPFGTRVAADCRHLEPDPEEREVIAIALSQIVHDRSCGEAANELNRLGHRTRSGASWTATAVFNLLPRMIEAGAEMFSTEEWRRRRKMNADPD